MTEASTQAAKRRARKAAAPTTPDPIEIAMDAAASGAAPDGVAAALLADQRRLIQADLIHRGWQIASERAGFALKLLTGAAGLVAAAALAAMAWQASRANGVVLGAFSVPPDLAQKGLTGAAVSSQILDELTRLQDVTESGKLNEGRFQTPREEIKVAIPTTGVSLGELQAALRSWLGDETHVTGEVFRAPGGGLTVRARISGRTGVRVEGGEAEFEEMSRRAAQAIFRQTRAFDYARMIGDAGDRQGAIAVLRPIAFGPGSAAERAAAYSQMSYHLQFVDNAAAIAMGREAIRLEPDNGRHWMQISNYEQRLGRLEAHLDARRRGLAMTERRPDRRFRPEARDPSFSRAGNALFGYDLPAAIEAFARADQNPFNTQRYGGQIDSDVVRALALAHNIAGARARLAAPRFASHPGFAVREADRDNMATARLYLALAAEDWADAIAADAAVRERTVSGSGIFGQARVMPYLGALALAKGGQADAARERLQSPPPPDCANCLYYAAMTEAALGDVVASERDFAAAAKLLPTLPQGHLFWGRARLERDDAAGALPLLREAARRQPRWADPFKYEGDALARLGRWVEAEAAYAKAAPLAPKWGGLHLRWGEALAKQGKTAEAQAKWKQAAALDLTPAERTELQRLMGGVHG